MVGFAGESIRDEDRVGRRVTFGRDADDVEVVALGEPGAEGDSADEIDRGRPLVVSEVRGMADMVK